MNKLLKLDQFPIRLRTDRDLEIPVLCDFLEKQSPFIKSVLDVGAHYTLNYYANEIRKIASVYHALDPLIDHDVEKIVDKFIVDNAVTYKFGKYDLVTCISVIEHVGQYPVKYENYIEMRLKMFKKMLSSAKKYFVISFPVGLEYTDPGEMSIITEEEFNEFSKLIKIYNHEVAFYYSEGPQAGHPWKPSDREKCLNIAYNERLGTQSLCVMAIEK